MAWFVSRRNCPSFLTANTVAGPLDRAHRSGRATGDHQDPAVPVLLLRRTPHQLRAPPHFASATALALGEPDQSCPGTAASDSTLSLTTSLPMTRHRPTERPPTRAQLDPRASLAAYSPGNPAWRHHRGPPSAPLRGCRALNSAQSVGSSPHGLFPWPLIPSLTSMATSLRWIRAKSPAIPPRHIASLRLVSLRHSRANQQGRGTPLLTVYEYLPRRLDTRCIGCGASEPCRTPL